VRCSSCCRCGGVDPSGLSGAAGLSFWALSSAGVQGIADRPPGLNSGWSVQCARRCRLVLGRRVRDDGGLEEGKGQRHGCES